jgi:Ca2+-binding RTX toxin-like protein
MKKLIAALALLTAGLTTTPAHALPLRLPIGMCGGDFGADPRPTTITGTGGPDKIEGTDETDVVEGLAGDDVIHLRRGIDWGCGNHGHDLLRGNRDEDLLYGGPGRDNLIGGPGSDILEGDRGDDVIDYLDTNQTAGARDFVWGGAGDDYIGVRVDAENGVIPQNRGWDNYNGGQGRDTISTADGNHNDVIRGGPGDDVCQADLDDLVENCERVERFGG